MVDCEGKCQLCLGALRIARLYAVLSWLIVIVGRAMVISLSTIAHSGTDIRYPGQKSNDCGANTRSYLITLKGAVLDNAFVARLCGSSAMFLSYLC